MSFWILLWSEGGEDSTRSHGTGESPFRDTSDELILVYLAVWPPLGRCGDGGSGGKKVDEKLE